MSLDLDAPPPTPGEPGRGDQRLAALLRDLGPLHVTGEMVTERIGDDEDHRLLLRRAPGEVIVELLWCDPTEPAPAHVDAVRVCGERREVWRSPDGGRTRAGLARLVVDLLVCDKDALRHHYTSLG